MKFLEDHLVTLICAFFYRDSKASSLMDEGDVDEEEDCD